VTSWRWSHGARAARRGRRALAAAGAGLAVTLLLTAAVVAVSRQSLEAAEQERLDERRRLVQRLGEFATDAYSPQRLATAAARTPFPRDDPAVAARLLEQFRTSEIGDPTALAAVVRRDGSVLAVSPAGATPPLADVRSAWVAALAGHPASADTFTYQGRTVWATAAPVGIAPRWGALVVVQETTGTAAQLFGQELGTLKTGPGGLFWLDRQGRVLTSWDPRRIGHQVADPAELARRPLGRPLTTTTGDGDDETTTVSIRLPDGSTVGFEQNTAALFADLLSEQRSRSLTLLAVFACAALGVLAATVRRLRAVRRSRARLDALLRNAHDVVLVATPGGTLRFVSASIEPLLGHDPHAWTGRSLLDLADDGDAGRLRELLADPDAERDPVDVRLRTAEGGHRWFDVEAGDVTGNPDLRGVLFTCREIGRRRALQEELLHQARHDALTGLPNRTVLTEVLTAQLDAARGPGSPAPPALLFLDLDRFKHVNDTWGHSAGDAVLRAVAERLAGAIGPDDVACRFGGDEFGIVLPATGERRAVDVARRLVAAVDEPVELGDGAVASVGVSVGVALPGPGHDAETLLRAADTAMYRAKRDRRGRYVVAYGDGPDQRSPAPHTLATTPVPAGGARDIPPENPVGPTDPAPADPARRPAPGRAGDGRLLGTVAPIVAATLAIVAVAGAGVWQTREARRTAEAQRTAERLRTTQGVAQYADVLANPQRLLAPVNAAPWALDESGVDSLVLQAVLASDLGGEGARAELHAIGGAVLASAGDGPRTGIAAGDTAWRAALEGRVGYVPLLEEGGVHYGSYAIPILRAGRPAAVLVIVQPLAESLGQRLLEVVGSLGFGDGGVSVVDADGRVTTSWDRDLIGTRFLGRDVVRSLPAGRAVVVDGPPGDVTLAAAVTSTREADLKATVFRQPAAAFFGDLRTGQTARDLTLLAVVLAAIGLVVAASWQRERALRRSERHLDALLRHTHDLVVVLADGTATFVSSAMTGLLGHDPQAWLHRPWRDLVHPDDAERLSRHVTGGLGSAPDIRLLHADGTYRWFDVSSADLRGHRALRGYVVTAHEVGERKRLQAELRHNARHDALTGLLNRVTFTDEIGSFGARGGMGYAVLFVDLDRFKPVNDQHGHDAGDAVLRTVADRLRACVPPEAAVCRLGGDEFAVLLTDRDAASAENVAAVILARLREPIPLPGTGNAVRIDSTIGIARSDGADAADVLRRADLAMYRGKQDGRGRYAVHA
jgi:diguanylate cyclase (GGDEF)-like protein/PAS domain S-box-containing protein